MTSSRVRYRVLDPTNSEVRSGHARELQVVKNQVESKFDLRTDPTMIPGDYKVEIRKQGETNWKGFPGNTFTL